MIKSRREKMISPIHEASIQDERNCILKLELVEITLLDGREDSPKEKKVRKHLFL
jgi:hypothetical protein